MHRSFTIAALAALAVTPAPAQSPDLRPATPEVRELPATGGGHLFQTRRFVIASDAPLGRDAVARFSQVIDTVPAALARLPLPLLAPPAGAPPRIEVLADDAYADAGGAPGTAGFYDGHSSRLLVRRNPLLAPPLRQATRLGPSPDQDLLVHEVTHLCMHRYLGRIPQWFAEGACEYLAVLHLRDGRFSFREVETGIRDSLRQRLDPVNPTLTLIPIATIAGLSGDGWGELTGHLPADHRYRPYVTALLLFHYHLHGGGARREALREKLTACLQSRHPDLAWLDPAAIPAIQQSLVRFWQPLGLSLRFAAD